MKSNQNQMLKGECSAVRVDDLIFCCCCYFFFHFHSKPKFNLLWFDRMLYIAWFRRYINFMLFLVLFIFFFLIYPKYSEHTNEGLNLVGFFFVFHFKLLFTIASKSWNHRCDFALLYCIYKIGKRILIVFLSTKIIYDICEYNGKYVVIDTNPWHFQIYL